MAALLVGMSVMSVALSMLLPAWTTMARREREAELMFRGNQYARAVAMYQRSRGAFPPSVDVLVNEKFLRKKYKDPMTEDGEFQLLMVGMPIPGQATAPAAPGRGGVPGAGGRGAGLGAGGGAGLGAGGRGGLGAGGGLGTGGGLGAGGGLGSGQGTAPAGGRGTGATLGTGLGGGTQAATGTQAPTSGFNRVTRPGAGGTTGPILGVVSKSEETSLRLFNGRNKYNEWAFVATEATAQAGGPGTTIPGGPGGTQTPGMGGRGGRGQTPTPGMDGGRGGFGPRGGGGFGPRGGGAGGAGAGRGGGLQLPGGGGRGGSPFVVP